MRHGIYVSERPTSLGTPLTSVAGLQVVVGTAPVNLADDPGAAVNVPKLVNSFEEAKKAVGYCEDFANYTLCQSIFASFKVFAVKPVILINVLDPATHKTDVAGSDLAVSAGQCKVTALVDSVATPVFGVIASTVVVKPEGGTGTAYVKGTDYSLAFTDDGYLVITPISATCKAETELNVAYSKLDPTAVDADDVVGAHNSGTNANTGIELVREIYPRFGLAPGILLAPGWSHITTVAAALQAKCTGIDPFECCTVLDIYSGVNSATTPSATVYSDLDDAKEGLGAAEARAYAVWPMLKCGELKVYGSAAVGALAAFTDANNDGVPSLSVSNKDISNRANTAEKYWFTAAVLADGTEVLLDQEQANAVNEFGVATFLQQGKLRVWGNMSCAYPETSDPKDKFWCYRRFFCFAGNKFILDFNEKVDDPTNVRLIEDIRDSANITGNSYVARGLCAGYRVDFLTSENPVASLMEGTIVFHMYLAPYPPAQEISCVREFDVAALNAALGGE